MSNVNKLIKQQKTGYAPPAATLLLAAGLAAFCLVSCSHGIKPEEVHAPETTTPGLSAEIIIENDKAPHPADIGPDTVLVIDTPSADAPAADVPSADTPAADASSAGDWEVYPQNGIVVTAVNVRRTPEAGSEIITVLADNEVVPILGTDGTLFEVETKNGKGYVARKYLLPERYLAGNHPPLQAPDSLSRIDKDKPMVALTFDDGPNAEITNRILNALEKHGAKATFFMLGNNVNGENNDCVRRMLAMGCDLGNHTYNHEYFNLISREQIRPEVRKADYFIEETCGQLPFAVRPPGGGIREEAEEELKQLGVAAIFWSVDTLDWETRNADNTYNAVMDKVRDGDIILMHDSHSETADAAERIIPALIEKGYQLVTVSELAAARGIKLEPGKSYMEFWKRP